MRDGDRSQVTSRQWCLPRSGARTTSVLDVPGSSERKAANQVGGPPHLAVLAVVGTGLYVTAAVGAFFAMPPRDLDVNSVWDAVLLLALAIVLLVLLYLVSLRRIPTSRYPMLRALLVITVFFVTYLLLMAYVYLSLESRFPGQVPGVTTHIDALYFTVTVLTTVGFGDITPVGQAAKAVVTAQMIFTLVVLGALVRSAATVGRQERQRRRRATHHSGGG